MCRVVDFFMEVKEMVELLMFFITGFFVRYFNMSQGQAIWIWSWYVISIFSYWVRLYMFINRRRFY